jgi:thiazole/oxazole-forming peptide maturase SagC family component
VKHVEFADAIEPEDSLDPGNRPHSLEEDGLASKDSALERLALNSHLRVVVCSDDEVLAKHGSRSAYSQVITDDAANHILGPIVRALREPGTFNEIVARAGISETDHPLAQDLLDYLRNRAVIVTAAIDPSSSYINGVLGMGAPLSDRLTAARIGLLGCGSFGSHVAGRLLAFNPMRLTTFEPRQISRSNDQQARATEASQALAGRLREQSAAEIIALDGNLEEAWEEIADADIVLVCVEQFSPRIFHAINEVAIQRPIPWLLSYLDGSEGIIHPISMPGETACYYELEAQSESTLTRKQDYHLYKEETLSPGETNVASPIAPYIDVIGGMTVMAALHFLMGKPSIAADQTIRLDFERMAIDYQTILKLPRCPACSGLRPAYRHLFL